MAEDRKTVSADFHRKLPSSDPKTETTQQQFLDGKAPKKVTASTVQHFNLRNASRGGVSLQFSQHGPCF